MTNVANSSDTKPKIPVIPGEVFLPFCLVTTLFALWGFANDITNPLVKAFQEVFLISSAHSSYVQSAWYGGYAMMAIPAAIFIRRFSYKAGILVGLTLYATGALLVIPASILMQFWIFLVAFFILTCGLAFLETTANPYVLAMGPASTATRRLNFAQAFNPIGSLVGMVVASQIVLASLGVQEFHIVQARLMQEEHRTQYDENITQYKADPTAYETSLKQREEQLASQKDELIEIEKTSEEYKSRLADYNEQLVAFKDRQMAALGEYQPMLSGRLNSNVRTALEGYADGTVDFDVKDPQGNKKYADHKAMQAHDLNVIQLPYVVLGLVVIGAFIVFAMVKLPKAGGDDPQIHLFETFSHLLRNSRYLGGVIAQTFYVAAQIMCWTFIIHYAMINLNMSLSQAQGYNIVAMAIFCGSRFICTYLLKFVSPGGLLMSLAVGGFALTAGTMFVEGMAGLYCLIGVSACMSLMFPTIYGIALDGLGDDAKLGSAGLIFAIVGGALTPPLQGRIIDMGDDITGTLDVGFTTMPAVSASFVLPLICFVVIAVYGYMTHNSRRQSQQAA